MNTETPLVSVRMSTYNHEKFIAQAIEGVLMQKTNFPFELIIGEDCSTDRTREIVVDYANRYPDIIKPILHEKNVGSKLNGRACKAACRGKYIAICEGDDYWIDLLKLQKQVDFMENHPECSLCHTYYKEMDENSVEFGSVLPKGKLPNVSKFGDYFPHRRIIRTATVMHRRELTPTKEELEPFMESKYGDLVLFTLLSMKGKIGFVPDVTTHYRVHRGGVSRGDGVYLTENLIWTYNELERVFSNKEHEELFNSMRAKLNARLASAYAEKGLISKAKAFLRISRKEKLLLFKAVRPRLIASLYILLPRTTTKLRELARNHSRYHW